MQRLCNHLEQLKPDPQPPKDSAEANQQEWLQQDLRVSKDIESFGIQKHCYILLSKDGTKQKKLQIAIEDKNRGRLIEHFCKVVQQHHAFNPMPSFSFLTSLHFSEVLEGADARALRSGLSWHCQGPLWVFADVLVVKSSVFVELVN